MRTVLLKQEYSAITNQFTNEEIIEERIKSLEPILEIVEYWKAKKLVENVDFELVLGSLRSLVYLNFHKNEIGEDKFNMIIEFLINQICLHIKPGSN